MPRAGWIALGAVLAALVGEAGTALLGDATQPASAIGMTAGSGAGAASDTAAPAALAMAAAILVTAIGIARRATPAVALGGGAMLILARLLGGTLVPAPPPAGPLPDALRAAEAEVISISTPAEGAQRAVVRLDAAPTPGLRLYARLPRYPEVVPGDRVSIDGVVRPPPVGPGFGEYLLRSGISGTVIAHRLERVPAPPGPAAWLERRRRDAGELLARVLPAPQAGLAAGILVGLRDQVDRDVATAFTAAGLTHIVAISGWNIAVVGGVIAAILRRVSRRRRSVATLAAIAAYALAAGAGASVVRAATMAAAVLGSRELGRPGTAAAALGLAVVAMLTVDPHVIGDAGFQLSVAATAGLLAWGTRLASWLRERVVTPGARLRAPGWLVDALGVSLAAQAATLPLILLDFGRVSLVSPLANLVAAPLVVPVMAASAAALAAGWLVSLGVPEVSGAVVGSAGAIVLGALVAVARVAAAVPGASITLDPPTTRLLAAAAALAVLCAASRRVRERACGLLASTRLIGLAGAAAGTAGPAPAAAARTAGAGATRGGTAAHTHARVLHGLALLVAAAGAAFIVVLASRPDGRLHLAVLDVGQGDAILLQGPAGGRILIDTGPDPDRLLTQLDERVPPWDRRLDLLVLTHPHEDHVGGAALLLRRYRVARIVAPGMRGTGPGWQALADELARERRSAERMAAGSRFFLDGVAIRALWPRPGSVPEAPAETGSGVNNVSIVLDVRFGARRFLLMGDAEQDVDAALLAEGAISATQLRVDLLKVAHHGSRTASTAAFLDAVRPRVAIVSVGAQNDYGHPAPATLARLQAAGARIFRTDLDGTITASSDGGDLRVESQRSVWRAAAPASPGRSVTTSRAATPDVQRVLRPRRPGTPDGRPTGCIESTRDPLACGSRRHPARSRSTRVAAGPRERRRRGRRVPRRALRGAWRPGRPWASRSRGPPPRRRQAAAARRPGAGAGPWRGRRAVAEPTGLPRTRTRRRRPPHHASPRRRSVRALERCGHARGADRRVRGQARRSAARGDECALRGLGRPLSGAPREPDPCSCARGAARTRGLRDRGRQPVGGAAAALGRPDSRGGASPARQGSSSRRHRPELICRGRPTPNRRRTAPPWRTFGATTSSRCAGRWSGWRATLARPASHCRYGAPRGQRRQASTSSRSGWEPPRSSAAACWPW